MEKLLRSLTRIAKQKLVNYKTAEQCGKWNCKLIEELQSDLSFNRFANSLHEAALLTVFTQSPSSDGSYISGIDYQIGSLIAVRFNMFFLSPNYFYAPAEIILKFDRDVDFRAMATYRCGIKDKHGGFKLDLKHGLFPHNSSEWHTSFSVAIGGGLTRHQKGKRP